MSNSDMTVSMWIEGRDEIQDSSCPCAPPGLRSSWVYPGSVRFTRACSRVLRKSDRSSHLGPDTASRKESEPGTMPIELATPCSNANGKTKKTSSDNIRAAHQKYAGDHVRRKRAVRQALKKMQETAQTAGNGKQESRDIFSANTCEEQPVSSP